jgi:23S rRNA pseudouridine1911/1915/1917 synthase
LTTVTRTTDPVRFVVTEALPRDRLDKCVVAALSEVGAPASRAAVQRWIGEGRVRVGGLVRPASAPVALGDPVEVHPSPPSPTTALPDPSVVFSVVYEDDDVVVVDKPANLVVHPARGNLEGTLVHGLLARGSVGADLETRGEAQLARPGIVHRLDKGTSGLLVVARNEAARQALMLLFARHHIEREYVAIVVGKARSATFDTPYGRHPRDRLRFTSRGRGAGGKRAITHVRLVEPLAGASLVACTLETGRTHQIRVHLAEQMGTPVLADPLYGKRPRDARVAAAADSLGRQALHAAVLGFAHPATGRRMTFRSPMPEDMQRALDALRA